MGRFEIVRMNCREHPDIMPLLPRRATKGSVGYDFYSLENIVLQPKRKHKFWTDVKVKLNRGERLSIEPRSSLGINKSLMVANTIGTVDPDYYGNPNNDGNIMVCMYNYGETPVHISLGERFAQGIIQLVVVDDEEDIQEKRDGGIGSTGK